MKKGLTLSLMTVALAMLGLQAMAMAPVIKEIPDPVVGNAGAATGPNQFVFPDAINLNSFVSDDNTTVTDLKWSYDVVGEQIYSLNGDAPLNGDDPTSPSLAKQINKTVAAGELNPDNNPATVTVRNIKISPLGASSDTIPAASDPKAASQTLTLYASDGESYDVNGKSIICYTDIGGADRFSGTEKVKTYEPVDGDAKGWTHPANGTITYTVTTANGYCMDTPKTGVNVGSFTNALGDIVISDGYVYHIRADVTSSQATAGHTPFWDMTISNPVKASAAGDPVPFHGANAYGVDAYFFDNQGTGGANAATTTMRSFHLWWAPAAIDTPQWKAGAFTEAMAAEMKSLLTFRVLDANNNPAISADNAWGTLCVKTFDIEKYPLGNMQKLDDQPVYSVDHGFSAANAAGTGTVYVKPVNGSAIDYTNGVLTITPAIKGNQQVELVNVYPSTDNKYYGAAGTTNAQIADDFPVQWVDDTLYQITVDMQAKDANGEANPFDAFFINVSEPSNEVLYSSLISTGGNMMGMPKVGTGPQTYMAFFYSHKATTSTTENYKRWRPSLQFASNASLLQGDNSGGVKISKFEVNRVKFN